MSSNIDFFPSLKGDKGLTVKVNKKSQITITFIGDNGPLTVVLDKDNSRIFIDRLEELYSPTVTPSNSKKKTEPINPADFVKETLRNLDQPWHNGPDISPRLTQEIDPKDHPFVRGRSGEVNQKLTGED